MPKAPGSGALWTQIKNIKEFKTKYIKEIVDHVQDALEIKDKQLYEGSDNLKAGAANFYLSEYSKLEREFRNTQPKDLVEGPSAYEKHKKKLDKEKKAGITQLLQTEFIPDTPEEKDGTND